MSRALPLLLRHSEMLGLAVGTTPRRQVRLDQKSACRKNQIDESCTARGDVNRAQASQRLGDFVVRAARPLEPHALCGTVPRRW
jgi:hypothetical protein